MSNHYCLVSSTIQHLRYSVLPLIPNTGIADASALQGALQIHASSLIRLEKERKGTVGGAPFPSVPSHEVKMSFVFPKGNLNGNVQPLTPLRMFILFSGNPAIWYPTTAFWRGRKREHGECMAAGNGKKEGGHTAPQSFSYCDSITAVVTTSTSSLKQFLPELPAEKQGRLLCISLILWSCLQSPGFSLGWLLGVLVNNVPWQPEGPAVPWGA